MKKLLDSKKQLILISLLIIISCFINTYFIRHMYTITGESEYKKQYLGFIAYNVFLFLSFVFCIAKTNNIIAKSIADFCFFFIILLNFMQLQASIPGALLIIVKKPSIPEELLPDDYYFGIFRICLFVLYLMMLFICRIKWEQYRHLIYIVFFFIYCVFIIVSFLPHTQQQTVLFYLYKYNPIVNNQHFVDTKFEIIDYFYPPIKEAILAFIIIDSEFVRSLSLLEKCKAFLIKNNNKRTTTENKIAVKDHSKNTDNTGSTLPSAIDVMLKDVDNPGTMKHYKIHINERPKTMR